MLWILGIILFLLLAVLFISYICYDMAFKAKPDPGLKQQYPLPQGKAYEPYYDAMRGWMDATRQLPFQELSITSFDGLTLHAKYYECKPGAPIELMFNGYRGLAERDFCGGVQRCTRLGHNALLVDQRCCGKSQGKVITFGIRERRDCAQWAAFMAKEFPDSPLILTGLSMGASTVLMAGAMELPRQVVGIIADCGFSSAKAIIQKVIGDMGLPQTLSYPFVRLGAWLWGGFNLEETSPIEAVKHCSVPVFFVHGEEDGFVPCHMVRELFAACSAPKRLLTVPGADHGLSYITDKNTYFSALQEFEQEYFLH